MPAIKGFPAMDLSYPQKKHLRKNADFMKVYSGGKRTNDPNLSLVTLARPEWPQLRLGLSVSRKVGNSVVRHRLKRRLREIFRLNQARFKAGFDLVLVA